MARIRILGGGWFGCHVARTLIGDGHEVVLHETGPRLFNGASGNNPARLHVGAHYPRSHATRAACQEHFRGFMDAYGQLTRAVPTNLYAIAAHHSMLDFGTYLKVLRDEIPLIEVENPAEFGLCNVEGAIQIKERHMVIDAARSFFASELGDRVTLNAPKAALVDDPRWGLTIDCTFCANDAEGIDRYEPCLVVLLKGPTDKAVTIMDGPFPSLYPWNEEAGLCSLSSAKFTPFSKECRTWEAARSILDELDADDIKWQGDQMLASMAEFYPAVRDFEIADYRLSIRAMPLSAADSRLVDVVRVGKRALRIRAGKIDAILHAAKVIRESLEC